MFDLLCDQCAHKMVDVFVDGTSRPQPVECPVCGGHLSRAWLTNIPNVIGDEIDIWIKHGLCEEDGSPRHFTSKQEIKRVTKEKKLVNRVEHVPPRDSDKSKHTQKWF